jgi:hypothetical protein
MKVNHPTDQKATVYKKNRITFTDGNTRVNVKPFGTIDGGGHFHDQSVLTVAAARIPTAIDPEDGVNLHR